MGCVKPLIKDIVKFHFKTCEIYRVRRSWNWVVRQLVLSYLTVSFFEFPNLNQNIDVLCTSLKVLQWSIPTWTWDTLIWNTRCTVLNIQTSFLFLYFKIYYIFTGYYNWEAVCDEDLLLLFHNQIAETIFVSSNIFRESPLTKFQTWRGQITK